MYYEINVSLNGQHLFATAERSISTFGKLYTVTAVLRSAFKAEDGYEITATKWETTGQPIDPTRLA